MKRCIFYVLFLNLIFFTEKSYSQEVKSLNRIDWQKIFSSPSDEKQTLRERRDMVVGNVGDVFVFAGGRDGDGIQEAFSQEVYILNRKGSEFILEKSPLTLKNKLAEAGATRTGNSLIYAGGRNENGLLKSVQMLKWDAASHSLTKEDLPDLPKPLKSPAAVVFGTSMYVAGGISVDGPSSEFFALNLARSPRVWDKLPNMPVSFGKTKLLIQSDGDHKGIYMINEPTLPLSMNSDKASVWLYDPIGNTWKNTVPDLASLKLQGSNAVAIGSSYILFEKSSVDALDTSFSIGKDSLYLFNTITGRFSALDDLPFSFKDNQELFEENGLLYAINKSPGATLDIWKGSVRKTSFFTFWDYFIVGFYLLLTVFVGLRFSGKQKTTSQYFKGGGKVPTWAVGISIVGAQLSAITFMSTPAKTYSTNWSYFLLTMSVVFILPIVNRYFIPFYRRLNITSAYEYLDKRFNYTLRFIASLLYILFEIGRLSIILILPSIALSVVTGFDVNLCVLVIGSITLLYTFKGGIRAVIWTDVMQVCILLGGAFLCALYILYRLPVDMGSAMDNIGINEKLHLMDWNFDLHSPNLWVALIGGVTLNFLSFSTDQTTVQRYLTTKDEKSAKRSATIAGWLSIPAGIVFMVIGTLLYLFYYYYPQNINVSFNDQDSIFPWFIVSELPTGIRGLLIAGVFAAAMSSLSSSMTSASTAWVTDFHKTLFPGRSDRNYLLAAKFATLFLGILAILIALWVINKGVISLWDQYSLIMGLFTGGIGGVFLLGIFTRRANATGALSGLLISGAIQFLASTYTNVHFLLYASIGLVVCFVSGWLISCIFTTAKKDITGLTIYSKGNADTGA